MPNKRASDQVLVAFAADSDIIFGVDLARKQTRQNRSAFIRDAIVRDLRKRGVPIASGKEDAPDRVKMSYPAHSPQSMQMNDRAAQKPGAGRKPRKSS